MTMNSSRQERRLRQRQEAKARRKQGAILNETKAKSGEPSNSRLRYAGILVLLLVVAVSILFWKSKSHATLNLALTTNAQAALPAISELVKMSDSELVKQGIARVNLACAKGLSPNPLNDKEATDCLETMKTMTAAVRLHTANSFKRFVRNPAEYENSEIYYKVAMLITVIEQDFGLSYNMAKATMTPKPGEKDHFFDDPADVFLHGAFGPRKTGTCSSMPVACVAVGRELGYPLKLVSAKGHLFFRWDDGTNRMNFECTNRVHVKTDEEFKNWPHPISNQELADGHYLRNLTPREELAVFLSIRSSVLDYAGQAEEAFQAMKYAYDIHPHPVYAAVGRALWKKRPVKAQPSSSNTLSMNELLDEPEIIYQQAMQRSRMRQLEEQRMGVPQPYPMTPNPYVPQPYVPIPAPPGPRR